MKQQVRMIKVIAIVFSLNGLLLTAATSFAEGPVSKAALRVDFNKMIEDNNVQRKNLHEDIDQAAAKPAKTALKKNDKDKAIDFIDVEIGVGQAPSVVDRRYDSTGEARVAPEFSGPSAN